MSEEMLTGLYIDHSPIDDYKTTLVLGFLMLRTPTRMRGQIRRKKNLARHSPNNQNNTKFKNTSQLLRNTNSCFIFCSVFKRSSAVWLHNSAC